jgi:hypothetical protein
MANSTPALYERTAAGHYGTSSSSVSTSRTPQVSANGTVSGQNSITLQFTETITRTATGVDVTYDATNTANSAKVISFTYSDTTPNNNGVLTGSQDTPANPPHIPVYSAAGFGFSAEYIGSSTANAQFSNVRVSFSSPVAGGSQSITFPDIADQSYGDPPIQLAATASSGLPITYQIVSGQAELSGNTLTPTGVGEITIRASQNGSIDFLPATPVEQTFTVNKATALVSLSDLTHTYDGAAKTATVTTDPNGLVVNLLYNGSQAAPVETGSYEVTAMVVSDYHEGSASGTLVIGAIPQTITFDPLPPRTYGDAPFELSASASSGLPVSFSIASGPASLSGNILTLTGAGMVTVRASQAGDETRAPAPDVEQSFTVAKATATVTLGDLSATYDGSPKIVSATTTPEGLFVVTTYDGQTTAPSAAGSYAVVSTVQSDLYQGSATGTLVIEDAHSALENWRFTHFGNYDNTGDAADTADPDADGLANLMEFALGLNPTLPTTNSAILQAPGVTLEYTYTRAKAAKAELDFIVEWSDTLTPGSWSTAGVVETSPALADDGTRETIKVTVPGNADRRFIRLRVQSTNATP